MSASDKHNTKHHYIQKAYLARFSKNKRLDVINRADGSVRVGQHIQNIALVKALYSIDQPDGSQDGILEDVFNENIEGPANNIIGNLCSLFPYVPQDEQRQTMAYYVALQYMRTIERKRAFEMQADLYTNIQAFNLSNKPDEIRSYLEAKGLSASDEEVKKWAHKLRTAHEKYEVKLPQNVWIEYLTSGIERITPYLLSLYSWHVLIFDSKKLITGDHPVVLRMIHNTGSGIGFINADEIFFPLSTNVLLLLTKDHELPEGIIRHADEKVAMMANDLIASFSYIEYYSHPDLTGTLEKKALGDRAIYSSEGPDDVPGFIKRFAEPPKRQRPQR
jgi:hypothetical protein